MRHSGPFSRLVSEFGGAAEEKKEISDEREEKVLNPIVKENITKKDIIRLTKKHMGKAAGTGKLEVRAVPV